MCGVTESVATGNPVYPIFDYRNIKKECKGWFTCQKNGGFNRFAMNNAEVVKLFKANRERKGSVRGKWKWSECNIWDGQKIKDGLMKSEIGPNTTVHLSDILKMSQDKKLKVLIYVGDQDFRVNWMGLEKVVSEIEWYGRAFFNEENALNYVPWTFNNATTGKDQNGGGMIISDNLTFLKVQGAGLKVHRE